MATFNVFVEGAVDESPMGLPELAEAMAQRYGLAANELVSRLKRGRFRVKSNVDAATAERYRQDLEAIGARVLIEDSAKSPTATPVAGTPQVRPSNLSLPPANQPRNTPASGLAAAGSHHARPSTPPPHRASTPIPADMVSGLSAAFGESAPQQDLGALADGALSLASLDGEEAPASSGQFDAPPPPPMMDEPPVVKIQSKPKTTEPPRNKPAPSQAMDLFAPPDAGDQGFAVDLAVEEVADRAQKKATAPPENTTSTAAQSQPLSVTRRTPVSMDAVAVVPAKQFDRTRFLMGVVLALVIGFIPAHFVANMREKSAFAAIDAKVAHAHASADTHETWAVLDGVRENLLEEKQSKRTMIALTSMLIWAAVAAGVAYAFSRMPAPSKKTTA